MPELDYTPPETGSFENALDPVSLAKRQREQQELNRIKRQADFEARQGDLLKVKAQAEKAVDLLGVQQSLNALDENLEDIGTEIKTAEKTRDLGKLQLLYKERTELERERGVWLDRQGQFKEARVATLREKVHRDLATDAAERAKIETERTMAQLHDQSVEMLNRETADEVSSEEAAEIGAELEKQARPDIDSESYDTPKYHPELIIPKAPTEVLEPAKKIPFPIRLKENAETEFVPVEQPVVAPPKKSWIPAPLRKWGKRLLVGLGLVSAGGAAAYGVTKADEGLEKAGQAASAAYTEYEKGIGGLTESRFPKVAAETKEKVKPIAGMSVKETAERLVAGQPVEIGGKTVQVSEAGSMRSNLPRQIEKAKEILDIEDYTDASFMNDGQTVKHFFEKGPGQFVNQKVALEAFGRMVKFNREQARNVLAKETMDQSVTAKAMKEIFDRTGL